MKKNPGRKERRKLARQNRLEQNKARKKYPCLVKEEDNAELED